MVCKVKEGVLEHFLPKLFWKVKPFNSQDNKIVRQTGYEGRLCIILGRSVYSKVKEAPRIYVG